MRRVLLVLAILATQGFAQRLGIPEDFRAAPGTVYLVPGPGIALPEDVLRLMKGNPIRVLWQPRVYPEADLARLAAGLRGRGFAVEVRVYDLYPPVMPRVVGANWVYVPPASWSGRAVDAGIMWKVVDLAWQNARAR